MDGRFAGNGSYYEAFADLKLQTIIAVTFCVNFLVSVPLNAYVSWLIVRGSAGTMTSEFFFLNLAVNDLLFSLSSIWHLLAVVSQDTFSTSMGGLSLGLLYTAHPLFGCLICVERYVAVVHPVAFLRYKPLRYRVACSCVAWLITLMSSVYLLIFYTMVRYLYMFFAQNVLVLFLMLFCCLSVLRELKRPAPGQKETEKKSSDKTKKQAYKIILMTMITMFSQAVLFLMGFPLQYYLSTSDFMAMFIILVNLALMTGFSQPVFYLRKTGQLCFKNPL